MTNSAVRTERAGPVTTVILSRPDRRNAVDRPTADALSAAFVAFDSDPQAAVAVFYGENGAFCAGADLKAIAEGKGNRFDDPIPGQGIRTDTQGPMGPSRLLLSKPVIAAISGPGPRCRRRPTSGFRARVIAYWSSPDSRRPPTR